MCRHVSIWGFQNRVCLSICPYPEKRKHHSFVNISPTLVIHQWKGLHEYYSMGTQFFFFKKVWNSNFDLCWNHHSFVNISPTLVIDTSMERSSRVLHHGNPKIWFFSSKSLKFEFWLVLRSWNHHSFVNISPTIVIDTSMERSSRVLQHGNPKIWYIF